MSATDIPDIDLKRRHLQYLQDQRIIEIQEQIIYLMKNSTIQVFRGKEGYEIKYSCQSKVDMLNMLLSDYIANTYPEFIS